MTQPLNLNIDLMSASFKEILLALPELQRLSQVVENSRHWHRNDTVLHHTLTVFEKVKHNLTLPFMENEQQKNRWKSYFREKIGDMTREQCLLWAALFHDIAKPDTITLVEGYTKCPGHESLGAKKTAHLLEHIIPYPLDRERIVALVENHDMLSSLLTPTEDIAGLMQKLNTIKDAFSEIFPEEVLLSLSDTEGSQLNELNPSDFAFRVNMYHHMLSDW